MKQEFEINPATSGVPTNSDTADVETPQITASFPLGRVVITAHAERELVRDDVTAALARHAVGDWGECGNHDRDENDRALIHGWQLHSVYRDRQDVAFWIITEADRSVTTVLLPSDY
jgi:hypothetical protein